MQAWINRYKFMGDIRLAGTFAYKWTQIKKITRHIFIVQYLYLKKVARKRIQSSKRDVESSKIPFQMLLKREQHLLAQAKTRERKDWRCLSLLSLLYLFLRYNIKNIDY